jgi:hypothetical protein
MMEGLIASGRIVDLIMLVILVEAFVLLVLWRRSSRALFGLLANLAAGAALLLALRCVLTGGAWPVTAAWLALAGIAHGVDLFQRLRDARTSDKNARALR